MSSELEKANERLAARRAAEQEAERERIAAENTQKEAERTAQQSLDEKFHTIIDKIIEKKAYKLTPQGLNTLCEEAAEALRKKTGLRLNRTFIAAQVGGLRPYEKPADKKAVIDIYETGGIEDVPLSYFLVEYKKPFDEYTGIRLGFGKNEQGVFWCIGDLWGKFTTIEQVADSFAQAIERGKYRYYNYPTPELDRSTMDWTGS